MSINRAPFTIYFLDKYPDKTSDYAIRIGRSETNCSESEPIKNNFLNVKANQWPSAGSSDTSLTNRNVLAEHYPRVDIPNKFSQM